MRLISHTDPGAPQLNPVPGSINALLYACLVSGFGTGESATAPLGWQRFLDDPPNHQSVFRPDPLLVPDKQYFVRVIDNDMRGGYVKVFRQMDDINDHYQPGATPRAGTSTYDPQGYFWMKHYHTQSYVDTNGSFNIPWYLIGDHRGFYFIWYDAKGYSGSVEEHDHSAIAYVGDINGYVLDDAFSIMASGSYHNIPTYTSVTSSNGSLHKRAAYLMGSDNGMLSPTYVNLRSSAYDQSNALGYGDLRAVDFNYQSTLMNRVEVYDPNGRVVRGLMPGLYSLDYRFSEMVGYDALAQQLNYTTVTDVEGLNGRKFFIKTGGANFSSSFKGIVMLEIDNDERAGFYA